ncbi:MAG TPA: hypothetical protein PK020_17525 [Ilumatobacteraceae bacterium]|nr:hypothetical protein [Ilumatobacteraceae bacterium]
MAKRGPKGPMTDAHKAALAVGRTEGKVVRDYLEALRANKPARGRKRTPDSIAKRLAAIDGELGAADAVKELRLVQERMDLEAELATMGATVDIAALEAEFVKVAKTYGERTGISQAAWRAVGVTPAVLKAAGISRTA